MQLKRQRTFKAKVSKKLNWLCLCVTLDVYMPKQQNLCMYLGQKDLKIIFRFIFMLNLAYLHFQSDFNFGLGLKVSEIFICCIVYDNLLPICQSSRMFGCLNIFNLSVPFKSDIFFVKIMVKNNFLTFYKVCMSVDEKTVIFFNLKKCFYEN